MFIQNQRPPNHRSTDHTPDHSKTRLVVFKKNKSMSDGNLRGELAPEITEISEKKRTQLPLINTASWPDISLRSLRSLRLKYLVSKPGVFFTRMAVACPVSVC